MNFTASISSLMLSQGLPTETLAAAVVLPLGISPAAGQPEAMNLLQAFILGLVQGLTEFLPISSSAHLKVVPAMFHFSDGGVAYTAIIQLGSIVAVVWYFWEDLLTIIAGTIEAIKTKRYSSLEFRLAVGIALGTVPILLGGLLIKLLVKNYDESPLRSLAAIGIASIVMSSLLAGAELIGKRLREFKQLRVIDGILMGAAQALALVPGVSRSGSTLTAGLFLGMNRAAAARFSFLLGIPAITLAGLVELFGVLKKGVDAEIPQLLVGTVSALIFSYLSIAWLLKFFQTNNTWVFVIYRLIFGVGILVALATGVLKEAVIGG
ncbi:MAG: undecaprenyl-diphosphate phosphatase [Pseudanabaenaceae cyanobacterium]|jgi:undecaprenyl-diphosphatase